MEKLTLIEPGTQNCIIICMVHTNVWMETRADDQSVNHSPHHTVNMVNDTIDILMIKSRFLPVTHLCSIEFNTRTLTCATSGPKLGK